MANVVITSTSNRVDVDFGDYFRDSGEPTASDMVNCTHSAYPKTAIVEVWKDPSGVFVNIGGKRDMKVGVTQLADNFVIDTVDAVAPTDNDHLYDLLKALI